jgi:Haem-binding domain
MKKALKIIAILVVLAFIAIQFIRPDFTNPPINQAETLEATTQIPDNVQAILNRSCKDCHSNETKFPWYSKIQPSAWFMMGHINEGRQEINFSNWKNLEPRRQRRKLTQICEQVQSKEMPLPSYLWIHWDAKMSAEDIKTLCDWTEAEQSKMAETK